MKRNILGKTHPANDPMEQQGSPAAGGVSEAAEGETIIHQGSLSAGHQLVSVEEFPRESDQAVMGPAGINCSKRTPLSL